MENIINILVEVALPMALSYGEPVTSIIGLASVIMAIFPKKTFVGRLGGLVKSALNITAFNFGNAKNAE